MGKMSPSLLFGHNLAILTILDSTYCILYIVATISVCNDHDVMLFKFAAAHVVCVYIPFILLFLSHTMHRCGGQV